MDRKRTVVAAAAASAVLVLASTAFAATSGIFASRRTDKVGSFEPVEEVLKPAPGLRSVPSAQLATTSSSSTSRARSDDSEVSGPPTTVNAVSGNHPDEPGSGSPSTEPSSEPPDDVRHDRTTTSTRPESDAHGSDDPTSSTTVGNVPTTDDGGSYDD